jgi:dynein heavy chain
MFINKCCSLAEILEVRHSVFIIGKTGTAKSAIWRTLSKSFTDEGKEVIFDIVDPKAQTTAEMYGDMNPKTKEWKDGNLCVIMRDMSKNNGPYKKSHFYKWVILDGDIDPMWIESMNTVMDDNKVLTLVSQERIPLTPEMRLVLEISHLRNATPATVSRGGVLFINDLDIGWKPYFESWMQTFKDKGDEYATNVFTLAQTQYIGDAFIEDLRSKEKIAPVCDMGMIHTLTCIVDSLYNELYSRKDYNEHMKMLKVEQEEEKIKIIYEALFVFGVMWAYGATLSEDKVSFGGQLRGNCAKVKFPDGGQVFDYFFDPI